MERWTMGMVITPDRAEPIMALPPLRVTLDAPALAELEAATTPPATLRLALATRWCCWPPRATPPPRSRR
jgi:hypothetical protein